MCSELRVQRRGINMIPLKWFLTLNTHNGSEWPIHCCFQSRFQFKDLNVTLAPSDFAISHLHTIVH